MIDWATFVAPCRHPGELVGERVLQVSADGELVSQFCKGRRVEGSHDSAILVRTFQVDELGNGTEIKVSGNLAKFFQGHNLFGTSDLPGLVCEGLERLAELLGLTPTVEDRSAWRAGSVQLLRVDCTENYALETLDQVVAWIRSADRLARMRWRGRGLLEGTTLYFGRGSRYDQHKFYSKGLEITKKGHLLPEGLQVLPVLHVFAHNLLRSETQLNARGLRERGLDRLENWGDGTAREVHDEMVGRLELADRVTLPGDVVESMQPRLRLAYEAWRRGDDLRAILPKMTFYRYRAQLLAHGIDIAIRQEQDPPSNVVPLVRILEARPVGVPEWAIGTPLYFEPRRRFG